MVATITPRNSMLHSALFRSHTSAGTNTLGRRRHCEIPHQCVRVPQVKYLSEAPVDWGLPKVPSDTTKARSVMNRKDFCQLLPFFLLCAKLGAQSPPGERARRDAEALGDSADTVAAAFRVPLYPVGGKRLRGAPFSAKSTVSLPSIEADFAIITWRRRDGSTRVTRGVVPIEEQSTVSSEMTVIGDYGTALLSTFFVIGGVLQDPPGIVQKPLGEEDGIPSPGESLVNLWSIVESDVGVPLNGIDGGLCNRSLLQSPFGSKTLEVWISQDLQIVLQEKLRRGGDLVHHYRVTSVTRSEPESSVFDLPA